jgi:hypothetical protein
MSFISIFGIILVIIIAIMMVVISNGESNEEDKQPLLFTKVFLSTIAIYILFSAIALWNYGLRFAITH